MRVRHADGFILSPVLAAVPYALPLKYERNSRVKYLTILKSINSND